MKKAVGLVIGIVLLVITAVVGTSTGCFENVLAMGFHINWKAVLSAIASVLVLYVVVQLISIVADSIKIKSHRGATIFSVIVSIIRYSFVIIALCAVLSAFGADVTTVVAGIGILALVIGFGAESLIADVITGLFSIVENQYNVGDIIEINGFRGTITNIGIRTTCITDMGGNALIVNNSNMKNILNRSNQNSKAVTVFPISYEVDLTKLESQIPGLLEEIYQQHSDVMVKVPSYIGVDELAESSVNLKFVCEVEEKNIHSAKRILNHDLYVGMKKLGIEVPYPQVDVHNR